MFVWRLDQALKESNWPWNWKTMCFIPLSHWVPWVMIRRILDISRFHSITCITWIILFVFVVSWQISMSWNLFSIKLRLKDKSSKATYSYTQSNWPTACANECSKVKVYGFVEPLKFIFVWVWISWFTWIIHCSDK